MLDVGPRVRVNYPQLGGEGQPSHQLPKLSVFLRTVLKNLSGQKTIYVASGYVSTEFWSVSKENERSAFEVKRLVQCTFRGKFNQEGAL